VAPADVAEARVVSNPWAFVQTVYESAACASAINALPVDRFVGAQRIFVIGSAS